MATVSAIALAAKLAVEGSIFLVKALGCGLYWAMQ